LIIYIFYLDILLLFFYEVQFLFVNSELSIQTLQIITTVPTLTTLHKLIFINIGKIYFFVSKYLQLHRNILKFNKKGNISLKIQQKNYHQLGILEMGTQTHGSKYSIASLLMKMWRKKEPRIVRVTNAIWNSFRPEVSFQQSEMDLKTLCHKLWNFLFSPSRWQVCKTSSTLYLLYLALFSFVTWMLTYWVCVLFIDVELLGCVIAFNWMVLFYLRFINNHTLIRDSNGNLDDIKTPPKHICYFGQSSPLIRMINQFCRYCRYNLAEDRMHIEYYLKLFDERSMHMDFVDTQHVRDLLASNDRFGLPTSHLCEISYIAFKLVIWPILLILIFLPANIARLVDFINSKFVVEVSEKNNNKCLPCSEPKETISKVNRNELKI
ncbi:hypothetical protein RFI_36669, partial [Reticulomyxa filosa]